MARRGGADGLTVRVRTGVHDGVACEGAQVPLSVSTNASSRAWLFSVLQGEASLGTMDVTRTPGGGDELLVAVAEGGGLGDRRLVARPLPPLRPHGFPGIGRRAPRWTRPPTRCSLRVKVAA